MVYKFVTFNVENFVNTLDVFNKIKELIDASDNMKGIIILILGS